jgi:serine/threonine-protein kinase
MTAAHKLAPHERGTEHDAAAPAGELRPGDVVDGRYRLEQLLGAGGMGRVYEAMRLADEVRVALKVLAHEWAESTSIIERFHREAQASNAARHPAFVAVSDVGSLSDGRPYLVMELVRGRPLSELMISHGRTDPAHACQIVQAVASALAHAHRAGVIHRDLKPDNLMLVQSADALRIRILDFGIAHIMGPLQARLTVGDVVGTAEYMAPEQAKATPPTAAVDVYALGVILFELLSGRVPISGSTVLETLASKSLEPAPSLGTRIDDLPAALVRLVDACLDTRPHRRPTIGQLVDALDSIQDGLHAPQPRRTRAATAGRAAMPRRRPRPLVFALVAIAIGVLVGALAVFAFDAHAASRAPATPRVDGPERAPGLLPLVTGDGSS